MPLLSRFTCRFNVIPGEFSGDSFVEINKLEFVWLCKGHRVTETS